MNIIDAIQTLTEAGKHSWFTSLLYLAKGTGDLAKWILLPGVSYSRQVSLSITALSIMLREGLQGAMLQAAQETMESLTLSSKGENYSPSAEAYRPFLGPDGQPVHGLRQHITTEQVEVFGVIRGKYLIQAGQGRKPISHKSELTACKAKLRKALPLGKWRAFDLGQLLALNGVKVEDGGLVEQAEPGIWTKLGPCQSE